MDERFSRSERLLGQENLLKLNNSRVAVFGIGGVGGYVAEALARAGVGAIDLIDKDVVSVTDINRQIYALSSTLGKSKVEVAKERIKDIFPDCKVTAHAVFFLPENAGDTDFTVYDYIVDAVDTVAAKLAIAEKAQKEKVPVISAMGAGNKLNATAFKVADIYETSVCPLAKVMRSECKKRGIKKLKVVYSEEKPKETHVESEKGRKAVPSSVSFVPPVMGLIIAGEVIKDLIKIK